RAPQLIQLALNPIELSLQFANSVGTISLLITRLTSARSAGRRAITRGRLVRAQIRERLHFELRVASRRRFDLAYRACFPSHDGHRAKTILEMTRPVEHSAVVENGAVGFAFGSGRQFSDPPRPRHGFASSLLESAPGAARWRSVDLDVGLGAHIDDAFGLK